MEVDVLINIFISLFFFVYFYSFGFNNENKFSGGFFMLIGSFSFLSLMYLLIDNGFDVITYLSPLLIIFWLYISYQSIYKMFWEPKTYENKNENENENKK